MNARLEAAIGAWGRPPDVASKAALGIAAVLLALALVGRGHSILGIARPGSEPIPKRAFLWLAAFLAALLSIVYIAIYLQGGSRIIDATHYFLQGRALSHGAFAWPAAEPSGSFRGRFLLHHDTPEGGVIGGIFPPGYPLLLAIGFGLGAPMVVGPAIAAMLVLVTYRLAHSIAEDSVDPQLREPVARFAALLSVACVTLRYHTADTMAHAASALWIALALDLALRAKKRGNDADGRLLAIGAGLAAGFVFATRPFSALGIGIVTAAILLRSHRTLVVRLLFGLVPGVALLWISQRAVTGSWWASAQRAYYAVSDAPADCFRWGFGANVGCRLEHADFVMDRLPHGYGAKAAAGVTLRRLHLHLRDVANVEPLALLVLAPLARREHRRSTDPALLALAVVVLQILAYVPFYFDGNYPGGGARFFADVLPIEHVLVALAVAWAAGASKGADRGPSVARAAYATLAVALAGFGVHASFDQIKLRDRDGGKPMFEPDQLPKFYVTYGIMFVDADHTFGLAADPFARAKDGLVVARFRDDDRDRLIYEHYGKPLAYRYKFDPRGKTPEQLLSFVAWTPPPATGAWRFEAEAEWPPLAQSGGVAAVGHGPPCMSNGKGLVVQPIESDHATATIDLPVPETGKWSVTVRITNDVHINEAIDAIAGSGPAGTRRAAPSGIVRIGDAEWTWVDVPGGLCAELPVKELPLTAPSTRVTVEAKGGAVTLDRFVLQKAK